MMNNLNSEMFLGEYDDWEYFSEETDEEGTLITESASRRPSRHSSTKSERFSFVDSLSLYQSQKALEAAALEETKRERLRKLLGAEQKDAVETESIETIITPEDSKPSTSISSIASSNLCLKDIQVSDSQLKLLHIYDTYPIPEDPGLISAFWLLYRRPTIYKENGIRKFTDITKTMELRPIRQVYEMLELDEVNLDYYGLDPRIMKPLCDAIMYNTSVQTLSLQDNWLTIDACFHLNELLLKNEILSSMNLAGCKIGAKGAERIEEGIGVARALEHLDVSKCDLEDEGLKHIATGVYLSDTLQSLDVSDNKLGEESAEALKNMLLKTRTLTQLSLSWNSFFTQEFWKIFITGLLKNETLNYLDLSYNALKKDSVPFLTQLLSERTQITYLNLGGNRLDNDDAATIAKSLAKNSTLEELYLFNNPFGGDGALAIVKAVNSNTSLSQKLRILDMNNIWATKKILPILKELKNKNPLLDVKLGGIYSNYKLVGPDARKIFLKRANFEALQPKKKKLRKDFGQFVIDLDEILVTRDAFKESVKKYKLKLTDSLVEEIMNAFAIEKDTVDQKALKEFYLQEYPDTKALPPKVKEKKSKKGKKGKEAGQKSPKTATDADTEEETARKNVRFARTT